MVRAWGLGVACAFPLVLCAERQGRGGGGVACSIAWAGEGLGLLHNPWDMGSGMLDHSTTTGGVANRQGHSLCPLLLH